MRRFVILAALAAFFIPGALSAAQVSMRDGSVIYGRYVSGTPGVLIFEQDNGVRRRVNATDIRLIDFSIDRPTRGSSDRMRDEPGGYPPPPPPPRSPSVWMTLPTGTAITVRSGETIRSSTASAGPYLGTIAEDVMDPNGYVLIPRGTEAELVVRDIVDRNAFGGGGVILDLNAVRVNGRRYMVDTNDIRAGNASGLGANQRTAEMVGGGAVLGTLLGAIAGGGKGAAIGALAGAAAGGGVQVLTSGHEVNVPAESMLTFRLEQPLRLRDGGSY